MGGDISKLQALSCLFIIFKSFIQLNIYSVSCCAISWVIGRWLRDGPALQNCPPALQGWARTMFRGDKRALWKERAREALGMEKVAV